ncbi:MAG TPA: GDSL-type esterase/lipase family protein [Vicinamibacteria bacterium]|nr:GDSL-type esterase/lipase family protein [Vicinamibacteria bacterium]
MAARPTARAFLANLALVAFSLLAFALAVEGVARPLFRRTHGHTYAQHHAFVPDPALVYHNNPEYFVWHDRPRDREGFFFIPPLDDANPSQRLWVLGGSTSAAMPDGSDWPAQLQDLLADQAVRVVNMGHEGYGSSQIDWLWRHEHDHVRPAVVIVFEGWNYRGALASRHAFKPFNASAPGDSWASRLSSSLVEWSAAYGSAFAYVHKHQHRDPCGALAPYPEMAQWEAELTDLLTRISRRDRVFLVRFPGLAMRDDVQGLLGHGWDQRCVAEHFAFHRSEYEARLAVLERAAARAGVTLLDARAPYLARPPGQVASYFRDYCHQNREGNAVLAQAVRRELIRLGALPAG